MTQFLQIAKCIWGGGGAVEMTGTGKDKKGLY